MAVDSKYHIKRFTTLARVGGAGFRNLARLDHHRSKHFERIWAMRAKLSSESGSLELWLGRGLPLNPYLRGLLISILRVEMRPKELRFIPDELFIVEKVKDFLEWSTLRSWVREWLKYCHWYYGTAMQPDVKLDSFLDAPVVNRNWKLDQKDENLIRFGLLWKLYDVVGQRGVFYRPPILEDTSEQFTVPWLLGGVSGTDFLVLARGVIQPRAGKGIIAPGVNFDFPWQDPTITTIRYKTLSVGGG